MESVMFGMLFLILLILVVIGTLPTWPHSRSWGYKPFTGVGILLIVAVVFMAMSKNGVMGYSGI